MASVPSSPRSGEADVEKLLQSLKGAIFSPSTTMETISDALTKLVAIYSCADELTFLPGSGQRRRATAKAELDRSLQLLDLCDAMQQSFADLKATMQEMQLARRRGDTAAVEAMVQSVVRLLAEAREIAVAALETAVKLLPKQIATMSSSSKWSQLVCKKKRAPCEEEQLQVLELDIAGLENGVQVLFRRLIQSRVSLLNTLTM
ncbi:hypothetical protein E2562_007202 [Oryza meyeriana var. granulata]|uniref:Uncharacterized protein n=1 Tax=Oryza meyeriana var. granulata TaxID=110450 RepID=A0A6G1CDV2_9ORYZ|nr:hypothetical protein E2562_007202 [Oryza meyeriana var. granulata]